MIQQIKEKIFLDGEQVSIHTGTKTLIYDTLQMLEEVEFHHKSFFRFFSELFFSPRYAMPFKFL